MSHGWSRGRRARKAVALFAPDPLAGLVAYRAPTDVSRAMRACKARPPVSGPRPLEVAPFNRQAIA